MISYANMNGHAISDDICATASRASRLISRLREKPAYFIIKRISTKIIAVTSDERFVSRTEIPRPAACILLVLSD